VVQGRKTSVDVQKPCHNSAGFKTFKVPACAVWF